MPTTVVTGAAGFIGSHVVRALLDRGERVVAIDDFNDYYDPAIKRRNVAPLLGRENFRLVESDIRDEEKMREEFVGADRVIHLAARAGVRPSLKLRDLYMDTNVNGTKSVLAASREAGVKSAVIASSSSVYGERTDGGPFKETDALEEPRSPYAESKQRMEAYAESFSKEKDLPINCLRFFTVYGPRQRPDMAIARFVEAIAVGRPIVLYGDGSVRRDFTYVDDIVQGVLAAADTPHAEGWRVYNLGESSTVSVSEVIHVIEKALGKEAVIRLEPTQQGDVSFTFADIARAKEELGYDPKTPIENGIKKYVDWFHARSA